MAIKKCEFCHNKFDTTYIFEGKRKWCPNRKYCYKCNPFNKSCRCNLVTKQRKSKTKYQKCKQCKRYLLKSKFYKSNISCKKCILIKLKNRQKNIKPIFKIKAVELLGNKCNICGYNQCIRALDFHHRDATTKEYNITHLRCYPFYGDKVQNELKKCDLLCKNCHKLHYQPVLKLTTLIDNNGFLCKKCKIHKTAESFYKKRYDSCKDCTKKTQNESHNKLKQICVDYKGGKCEKCGFNKCNSALEFHHLDPKEKDFNISTKGGSELTEEIKAELDKCKLLCSNCHSEEHYLLESCSTKM